MAKKIYKTILRMYPSKAIVADCKLIERVGQVEPRVNYPATRYDV